MGVLDGFKVPFERMWSTALTIVQQFGTLIARKGVRNILSVTRCVVTLALSVSSLGNKIVPFYIFSGAKFWERFLVAMPPGSVLIIFLNF